MVILTATCPMHAQIYNQETWTRPLSFDFALSFNTRQNCIHSWFYYCNFKHGAINFKYIRKVIKNNRGLYHYYRLKHVKKVTVDNRGLTRFHFSHRRESSPYCHNFDSSQSIRLPVDCSSLVMPTT